MWARLFTAPALIGEFTVGAYWRGVELVWRMPAPSIPARPVTAVFAEAMAGLCAGSDTVGVQVSGGLDSLAVLCQAATLSPPRLVAYCVALTDDQGVSSARVSGTRRASVAGY